MSRRRVGSVEGNTLRGLGCNNMAGAIILSLMHQSPSELRSYMCFGESSTRMGDLLRSPRVTPLISFSEEISMIYVCIRRANRFCPSHFHPHKLIADLIPRSLDISRRN